MLQNKQVQYYVTTFSLGQFDDSDKKWKTKIMFLKNSHMHRKF